MAILSTPLQYLGSIPTATRVLAGLMVVVPCVYSWLDMRQYTPQPVLTVVPGASLIYPWALATALFVELSVISWIFTFIFMISCCRYLERLWGPLELTKFILLTGVISNAIACGVNWLEYLVLGQPNVFLYGQQYYGLSAVTTGILVAFTQLIPEHQVQLLGVLRIRVKRLPMIYVTISTVLCLVGFQAPWILIQFGWLVSWTYLRFYKRSGSESGGDTYGDRSETFAFVHWFPPFVHPPIAAASNVAYNAAVRIRLVRPFGAGSPDLEAGYNAPGGARAEAERRRAMALKALDQRMQNANAASSSSAPSAAPPAPSADQAAQGPAAEAAEDAKGKGKVPSAEQTSS